MVTVAKKFRAKFETWSPWLWLTSIDGVFVIFDPHFLLRFMFSWLIVCLFFFFFWKLPQILSGKRKRINKWVKVYPKLQRIDYSYILGNETLYSFSSGDNETIPYIALSKLEFSESWLLSSLCLSWNISTCRNVGRIVSQIKPCIHHQA